MPRDVTVQKPLGQADGAQRRRRSQPLNGLRVLCIDNEPQILEGMALLLTGWGCTVGQAGSLAALEQMIASREPPPDIIIGDYHLGDGTGIDAILDLRAAYGAEIPALLVTADRSPEVRAEAERHDIGVQHKPLRPAALRAHLTQVAGVKRIAAE
jgi:CheY-like chemotaxis protein